MNDTIRLACERACEEFGDHRRFNSACFSAAFCAIAGVRSSLDGKVVRAMLAGRRDVDVLKGGCHFELVEQTPVSG